jgi:hypothetical protein
MDSTTIELVAHCIDWARHRRKKAAAKLHVSLNLETFLPRIAIVDTARHHDKTKAWSLCAVFKAGEIVFEAQENNRLISEGLQFEGGRFYLAMGR